MDAMRKTKGRDVWKYFHVLRFGIPMWSAFAPVVQDKKRKPKSKSIKRCSTQMEFLPKTSFNPIASADCRTTSLLHHG